MILVVLPVLLLGELIGAAVPSPQCITEVCPPALAPGSGWAPYGCLDYNGSELNLSTDLEVTLFRVLLTSLSLS